MNAADPPRHHHDPDLCFACNGTGFCAQCGGDGRFMLRSMHMIFDCARCAGSGVCPECDGTGRVLPEAEDD